MLKLEQVDLIQNHILIEEYPVEVDTAPNGVHRSEEDIRMEKERRFIRIGKVIKVGKLSSNSVEILPSSLTRGEVLETVEDVLYGKNIAYYASSVNPFDTPIENCNRPLIMNIAYIISAILPEQKQF